ncbi:MAG: GrdX family protein [Lachnospiraceae bacterium]
MKYIIVTNNFQTRDKYADKFQVDYIEDGTYLDVLLKVRDYVQKNHSLVTHPLAGSMKPNQIPYRSIIVSDEVEDKKEFYDSCILIENSIEVYNKFIGDRRTPQWKEAQLEDFRDVELTLLDGAVANLIG